jgi:hypothetical protein
MAKRFRDQRKQRGQENPECGTSLFAAFSVILFALYLPAALLLVSTIVQKVLRAPFFPDPGRAFLVIETTCGAFFQLIIFIGDALLVRSL